MNSMITVYFVIIDTPTQQSLIRMSNFYAVLKGRVPGIYTDWNECKKQTDGFSGPVFRKFSNKTQAEKFLKLDPSRSYPVTSESKPVTVKENIKKTPHLTEFVRTVFNTTIKLFRVSDETLEKIARSMWDDLENADEGGKDIFRLVLEEYLPIADCFYVKPLQTFLDSQSENKLGYGKMIEMFSEAYRKDGSGKNFQSTKISEKRPPEIIFDDGEEDFIEIISPSSSLSQSSPKRVCLSSVLYTDGAHNKTTGTEAWGSVVNEHGGDVMEDYQHCFTDMVTKVENLPVGIRRIVVAKFNDVSTQQVNGAELLALIIGLRLALASNGEVKTIKCDSKLMTEYWSKYLKKESRDKMDPRKAKYVDELISLRKQYEKIGGIILKISGDDNLSDLGYHIKKG